MMALLLSIPLAASLVAMRARAGDGAGGASTQAAASDDASTEAPIEAPSQAGAASTDGGTDGSRDAAPAAPHPPFFSSLPFSGERTPRPSKKEWNDAAFVSLDRELHTDTSSWLAQPCKAQRLREWIRVRCEGISLGAISLLGGDRKDLVLQLDPVEVEGEFGVFPEGGEIVFPVRPGDRRVIEWLRIAFGYKGANSIEPFFVLSEEWLEGEPRPTIVVH